MIIKRLILAALLLLPQAALAGAATLSWDAPTQNTDGSALTDLAGYKIYYGQVQGEYAQSVTLENPGLTSYVLENLAAGEWYFQSTAFNSSGIESSYSNVATKTIPAAESAPNPPLNFRVLVENQTAYAISQSENVVRLYPVGTIAADSACDSSMEVLGRFRVDVGQVEFYEGSGDRMPAVVFANCGAG